MGGGRVGVGCVLGICGSSDGLDVLPIGTSVLMRNPGRDWKSTLLLQQLYSSVRRVHLLIIALCNLSLFVHSNLVFF